MKFITIYSQTNFFIVAGKVLLYILNKYINILILKKTMKGKMKTDD